MLPAAATALVTAAIVLDLMRGADDAGRRLRDCRCASVTLLARVDYPIAALRAPGLESPPPRLALLRLERPLEHPAPVDDRPPENGLPLHS